MYNHKAYLKKELANKIEKRDFLKAYISEIMDNCSNEEEKELYLNHPLFQKKLKLLEGTEKAIVNLTKKIEKIEN